MVKHIVAFKFANSSEELSNEMKEKITDFKLRLENLQGIVPSLLSMEVGINDNPSANYTMVLTSTFDSYEGLNDYVVHPAHQEISKDIRTMMLDRACVDYCF